MRWLAACTTLTLVHASFSLSPPQAQAADGVVEINQTCATTTGCFPGDDPLFPVTITPSAAARNFQLTSDLSVPDENTSAIVVSHEHVSIDLHGFAILGPSICSGFPIDCTPIGSGLGIHSSARGTSVRGGTVSGVGSAAINLDLGGIVENVRVYENAGSGIRVPQGIVRDSVVFGNRGVGISIARVASGNTVEQNRGTGIAMNTGIAVDNTIYQNGGGGITSTGETTIRGNTITRNGLVVTASGIECTGACNVIDNHVYLNSGWGLEAAAFTFRRTSYHGNRISDNTLGAVTGQVVDQGQNLCTNLNTVLACP